MPHTNCLYTLTEFEFTAAIACFYHVNDMASKTGQTCPDPAPRRSVLNWRILFGICFLFPIFQDIGGINVSGLRLARRMLDSDDLVRGLQTQLQIPDGLRTVKDDEPVTQVLDGHRIHLYDLEESREEPTLGSEFKSWIRSNQPVEHHDDQDAIYHESELRAAWYIFLKSKHPDLYWERLGRASIIEAVERQGDRVGRPERTLHFFLEHIFRRDGEEGAKKFMTWMESQYGPLQRNKFYNLKELYRSLITWIDGTEGSASLIEFPRKKYYSAWSDLAKSDEELIKLMNRQLYPLAKEPWEKLELEEFLPTGYFKNPISAELFFEYLSTKIPHDEVNKFCEWLMKKHYLQEKDLKEEVFPRNDLALNFVKWVDEQPIGSLKVASTQLSHLIGQKGVEGAASLFLEDLNARIVLVGPEINKVPLDQEAELNRNIKGSNGAWKSLISKFKNSARNQWNKIKDTYQIFKNWLKKSLHFGPQEPKKVNEE